MNKDLVVQDHTGRKFCCISAMCRHYRIKPDEFMWRMSEGWTVEEALTSCRRSTSENKVRRKALVNSMSLNCVKDHIGQSFPSVEAMCLYYDIPMVTYMFRRTQGWDLREALTTPVGAFQKRTVFDHMGQKYESVDAMCRHYRVAVSTFKDRIKKGWSLEKALTVGAQML